MSTDWLPSLRSDFPVLNQHPELTYLDSAATSLKPQAVIDEVLWYLTHGTGAIYRGVHQLGVEATERFDEARGVIAGWFDVADDQVVLTRGTTDAINLVAQGWQGLSRVITTHAEHHSNLLPWRRHADVRMLGCDSGGRIAPDLLDSELNRQPADLVAVSQVTNVLGTLQPIQKLAEVAHRHGAKILVDVAQSAAHGNVELDFLGADFLACSAHKMLGPDGVGALIGQPDALEMLQPSQWGGGMVESVTESGETLQSIPRRLEAGTPVVESVLGWAAAIEYLDDLAKPAIDQHLRSLTRYGIEQLQAIDGVEILGDLSPEERLGILPIAIDGWEAHAAARVLSQRSQICVRSGFHCAEPLHQHFGWPPTLRASLHVYSTCEDVDRLAAAIRGLAAFKVG